MPASVAALDDRAVVEIFSAQEQKLRHYALRILHERHGVSHIDDVIQNALLYVLVRLRSGTPFDSERHVVGALFGATKFNALRALVDHGLMVQAHVKTAKSIPVGFVHETPGGDELDNAITRASLIAALAMLPPRERDVFLRCDYRGDSHEEVADELGMRKPQVALTLYRARNRVAWHVEHGDRPYYANGSCGLRKSLVREAKLGATEKARKRLAEGRRQYARRKLHA